MNQLSLNWPTSLQSQDDQLAAIQLAFQTIQNTVNSNATQPQLLIFLPSQELTTEQSTTSTSFVAAPGFSWTINSQGGLVVIDAIIAGTMPAADAGTIQLMIDGNAVLAQSTPGLSGGSATAQNFSLPFHWADVLGAGQHIISLQFKVNSGTLKINDTSISPLASTASIVEFPTNVSNLDVTSP